MELIKLYLYSPIVWRLSAGTTSSLLCLDIIRQEWSCIREVFGSNLNTVTNFRYFSRRISGYHIEKSYDRLHPYRYPFTIHYNVLISFNIWRLHSCLSCNVFLTILYWNFNGLKGALGSMSGQMKFLDFRILRRFSANVDQILGWWHLEDGDSNPPHRNVCSTVNFYRRTPSKTWSTLTFLMII
jgi:hypothetical protein